MKTSLRESHDREIEIVAIAPNTWTEQWELFQRLSIALARHVPVIYVQEPQPWYKTWSSRDEGYVLPTTASPAPNIQVLKLPKFLARRGRNSLWNEITCRIKSRLIARYLRRDSRRILYIWHPELLSYRKYLRPDATIYHIFDIVPPTETSCGSLNDSFLNACKDATNVLAGTRQQAHFVPRSDVNIVGNAVSFEDYTDNVETPGDLAILGRPRIGFVGSITDRLDFDWLEAIAEQESWVLVLAGPCYSLSSENSARFDSICLRPNVSYLGCKRPREVAAYLKGLDVGLMNYKRGKHCDVASPIKLYEYCAAGLPIVSTRLPSLVESQDARFIDFADTPQEAVLAIQHCLQRGKSRADFEERRSFAQSNSWDSRAKQILGLIGANVAN